MPQIKSHYIDTDKVRFVFRNFAFLGQESIWAAEAAHCAAEQGEFWEYHDYLYNHQGAENSGAFSKANLEAFAAKITGIDAEKFKSCLESDKYAAFVQQDTAAGREDGVSGTPTTFVGPSTGTGFQTISGAQPYAKFKQVIDAELAKVNQS